MILWTYHEPRPDPRRDPAYLRWIRKLPCVVCAAWALKISGYYGWTEAAHVGERGLGQKCADTEALPLCVWHHRMGPKSVHVLGRKFWEFWKLDRYQLIAKHNQRFQKQGTHAA